MNAPRTQISWIKCVERLPDIETYGPYPRVLVATSYHEHLDWGFGIRIAELRFINGDKQRPTWVSADKVLAPIESFAYGVTHWADCPEEPKA